MIRSHPRIAATVVSLAAAACVVAVPAQASARPDTGCMQAGIATLQGAGLLDDVARGGIAIETAVSLGVAPREGADLSGVPDPIPLSLLLADHRAGEDSLFVYPWC